MDHGFSSVKDVLDVVVVPLVIFLLGVFWPLIQAQYRCIRFRLLARRELEEIEPYLDHPNPQDWASYLTKEFVHQKIISKASENRDFILGLDPEFVYWLSQLWSAYSKKDAEQWLYYLGKLSTHRYTQSNKLREAIPNWENVINNYKEHQAIVN